MSPDPRRGEIWLVRFDPAEGSEIRKSRPAIVISSDSLRSLPIRLVAPVTGWNDRFANTFAKLALKPTRLNGLSKPSAVDVLQLRAMDTARFLQRMGRLTPSELREIARAIMLVIEQSPGGSER